MEKKLSMVQLAGSALIFDLLDVRVLWTNFGMLTTTLVSQLAHSQVYRPFAMHLVIGWCNWQR